MLMLMLSLAALVAAPTLLSCSCSLSSIPPARERREACGSWAHVLLGSTPLLAKGAAGSWAHVVLGSTPSLAKGAAGSWAHVVLGSTPLLAKGAAGSWAHVVLG